MTATPGSVSRVRVVDRDSGLACVTAGWRDLVARVYDLIEATPGVAVRFISQRQGLLWVECSRRPLPAHVLWRLAATERLSGRICQVCALPGRVTGPRDLLHWVGDGMLTLCRYHEDCQRARLELHDMVDERLAVLTHAPPEMRPLLVGDVTTLAPLEFRRQLVNAGASLPTTDADGYVFPGRIAWVLTEATDDQLAACGRADLEPFFGWDEAPDVREAALVALASLAAGPAGR